MCKCRSLGTFPLFGIQSSHLNICYYHQDLHRRPLRPCSRPMFCSDRHALLLIGAWHLPRRPGVGCALKRHPFSGLVDLAGIVHHLLGPDRYAHTRTLLRRSSSVGGAPLRGVPPISFLAPYGFTRPLTHTHVRLLGPCFKTGQMGSPEASVRSAEMPKRAGDARCLPQSRRRRSMSVSRARSLAAPQSTLVHTASRSGDRLVAVPHPTGVHRRPPSASLPTISSTLLLSF
ncbi:hypothetical protein FXO38_36437, partial [Capsicum annuum]